MLRLCSEHGIPVVPQGGNTGLVGGSVPAPESPPGRAPVVLSLRRLDTVGEVDPLSGQLTAGAGATLGAVRGAAAAAGWRYGVDLAARDSATIGGTVATNAGGIHVIAYGMTRAQVVGVEAVLPDGTVVSHLSGLLKDNTGYDLGALLCGSEGTLGVITAVRLRLHRPPGRTTVALIGCDSYDEALDLMVIGGGARLRAARGRGHRRAGHGPGRLPDRARRGRWPTGTRSCCCSKSSTAATPPGWSASTTADVGASVSTRRAGSPVAFPRGAGRGVLGTGPVPTSSMSRCRCRSLARCADELREIIDSHPAVVGIRCLRPSRGRQHPRRDPWSGRRRRGLGRPAVSSLRGRSRRLDLGRARSRPRQGRRSSTCAGRPQEIDAMRAIKSAWDPQGLMNPGVIFSE